LNIGSCELVVVPVAVLLEGVSLIACTGIVSGDAGFLGGYGNILAVGARCGQVLGNAFPFEAVPLLTAIETIVSAINEVAEGQASLSFLVYCLRVLICDLAAAKSPTTSLLEVRFTIFPNTAEIAVDI